MQAKKVANSPVTLRFDFLTSQVKGALINSSSAMFELENVLTSELSSWVKEEANQAEVEKLGLKNKTAFADYIKEQVIQSAARDGAGTKVGHITDFTLTKTKDRVSLTLLILIFKKVSSSPSFHDTSPNLSNSVLWIESNSD